jgi:hypothetical protein
MWIRPRTLTDPDPFGIFIVILEQVFSCKGIILLDCSRIPTVVDGPENTNLLSNHAFWTKSGGRGRGSREIRNEKQVGKG